MLSIEVLMQAVIIALTILEQQRRRTTLPGIVAPSNEVRVRLRKAHIDAERFVPAIRSRGKPRIQIRPQLLDRIRQWIAKILVLAPSEAMPRHSHAAAKEFILGIKIRNRFALLWTQQLF